MIACQFLISEDLSRFRTATDCQIESTQQVYRTEILEAMTIREPFPPSVFPPAPGKQRIREPHSSLVGDHQSLDIRRQITFLDSPLDHQWIFLGVWACESYCEIRCFVTFICMLPIEQVSRPGVGGFEIEQETIGG